MSKNVLDNLFSSRVRVKVLKFLFRNYPADFDMKSLADRIQEPIAVVKKEIETLREIGLVKKKR
jgi:predicted transcriptional regulator